ncbi:MAG: AMP-binding protein, partial [Janthinobacterium lividum]
GIACGSGLAAFLSGARTILLPATCGSAVFGLALADLWWVSHGIAHAPLVHAGADLFVAALGGGMLAVPTQAAIQAFSPPERRSRTVAGSNVVGAVAMTATAVLLVAAQLAGLREPTLLGVTGVLCLAASGAMLVTLSANPAGEAAWMLFRVLFRIRLRGGENLPHADEAAVVVPNHVSWLDATVLFAVMETPPLFAIDAQVAKRWWVRPLLRLVPTLPVDAASPYSVRTMVQAVQAGARLVLFPEGRITVTGSLMEIQHGAASIADKAGVPVVPVRLQGLERTPFSRLTRDQARRALFPSVTVTVLPQQRLQAPEGSVGKARREALTAELRDVMEEAVTLTTPTDLTLFQAVAGAARTHGLGRLAVEDPVSGPLSYRRLLAGADVLGEALSRGTAPGEAVGLLLPTANATALCLIGLSSWGRVPAMLNATAGLASLRAAVTAAEVRAVVTSRAFVDKARLAPVLAGLEGQVRVVFLEDVRAGVTQARRLRALLRASLATARPRLARTPDERAVVMFTSGSSGTPKGVVLTHRNLLANVAQVGGRIGFGRADRVLNTLPMFHAIGLSSAFLLPLTSGIPVFLYPSPLHYAVIPQVAYGWNATALFGTSTFLRGYARRAPPTAFRSLRLVVAGAERVQPAVREAWMERFGLRIFEGYGATECAPVLALNTPVSNRSGTVGRLLPGMAMRLAPVDGMEGAGRLSVSGPNVMAGYLLASQPGVLQAPADGWYDTGDIVSVDDHGHLAIVGRASRIAKPGGEMVSLAAVEDLAAALWPEAPCVAVVLPDPRKGERIVLLTEEAGATRQALLAHARAAGAADLMLPSEVRVVERLPMLGSGKPDFVAAGLMAAAVPETAACEEADEESLHEAGAA